MRFLGRLLALIIVCAVLFLAGDYFNLPLWPVDWLKSRIPVEIKLKLTHCTPEEEATLFRTADGAQVEIYSASGTLIQALNSDVSGVTRTVLPEGDFFIRGSLVTVLNSEFFQFTSQSELSDSAPDSQQNIVQGVKLTFNRSNQDNVVTLMRQKEISQESLQQQLQLYLKEGDLQSALVVARDMGPEVIMDIETLISFDEEMGDLPVSAYNSAQDILNRMIAVMEKQCPNCPGPRIRSGNSHIYLESRLKAIEKSRDDVIQSYIDLMDEFIGNDRMEAALAEWNQLVSNPELIQPDLEDEKNLPDNLVRLEEIILEFNALVPEEIKRTYEACVAVYESGEIQQARLDFTRFLRQLRNLSLHEEYAELESNASSYLDDISLISSANDAIRKDKLEYALELLDIVLNTNTLVDQRVEEATFLLSMRTRSKEKGQTP